MDMWTMQDILLLVVAAGALLTAIIGLGINCWKMGAAGGGSSLTMRGVKVNNKSGGGGMVMVRGVKVSNKSGGGGMVMVRGVKVSNKKWRWWHGDGERCKGE